MKSILAEAVAHGARGLSAQQGLSRVAAVIGTQERIDRVPAAVGWAAKAEQWATPTPAGR